MAGWTPELNLPTLKRKGLSVYPWIGHPIQNPFYKPSEVMPEGAPVKFDTAIDGNIKKCVDGDGAACIGLALQEVYDDSVYGQLQGYNFPNDTRERLASGRPIGVLQGNGFAETINYAGTVGFNSPAYVGPSGLLVTTGHAMATSQNKLPVTFEGVGTDGYLGGPSVRIRFAFPVASRS